ncbi:MAG: Hsp20/alpha crystallin family protein, partial [Ktedonobacteraceae bacterium]|nr:Hsp20/alpha crystallin family protein [Ktedonobacteraceae bacterium]
MSAPQPSTAPTQVAIKLYRSHDRLTIAAPMPGLEPSDITAEVTADHQLILHGEQRGIQKGINDELMNEWNPGPYHREIALPHPVDATIANVTYGNGVLVVSLPLSDANQPAKLVMQQTGTAHGVLEGATGHTGTVVFTTTGDASPLNAGGDSEESDRAPEELEEDSFADITTEDLMPDPLAQPLDTDATMIA